VGSEVKYRWYRKRFRKRHVDPYQPSATFGRVHRAFSSRKRPQEKKSGIFAVRMRGVKREPPVTELDDVGKMTLMIAPDADTIGYLPA
jgi:hypothetical protein